MRVMLLTTLALVTALAIPRRVDANPAPERKTNELAKVFSTDPSFFMPALGTMHFFAANLRYTHRGYLFEEPDDAILSFNDGRTSRASVAGEFTIAFTPLATIFGGVGGFEINAVVGLPLLDAYFAGLGGDVGLIITPFPSETIRLSVVFGAGLYAHRFAFIKPKLGLRLGQATDIELSYRWIPEVTSTVARNNNIQQPGEDGIGEQRVRGSLFVPIGDAERFSQPALHLFVEWTSLEGSERVLLDKNVRQRDYWGGGIGYAF